MPVHVRPFFAALLVIGLLAGCNDATQQSTQDLSGVQRAVQEQYRAEEVNATLHRNSDGAPRLEVTLVNPGGDEATNRRTARSVAQAAQAQYEGSDLETVKVSFEYSSANDGVVVGFHRRYTFAPGDLQGSADTTAAPTDTAASGVDTAAVPRP